MKKPSSSMMLQDFRQLLRNDTKTTLFEAEKRTLATFSWEG